MRESSEDFRRKLEGYGLLMAEITYCLPDSPSIISPRTFMHQMYDIAPRFPVLHNFIEFWMNEMEGRLKLVRYDHQPLIGASEYRGINGVITIN